MCAELTSQKQASKPQGAAELLLLGSVVPTEAVRLVTTSCPHRLSALSPSSSHVRPCPLCLLPSRWPLCPRADMSSDNWTQFWLVSKVGLPLVSWNVLLHFYTPIGSANSATPTHSHTLTLSSQSCSSGHYTAASHSLATKPVFPVISLLSFLGPVILARFAVLGPSLDQGSSLQLLSHLNFLIPFPFIHPPGAFHPSSLPFLLPLEGHKCCRRNAYKIALPSEPLCLAAHQLSSS